MGRASTPGGALWWRVLRHGGRLGGRAFRVTATAVSLVLSLVIGGALWGLAHLDWPPLKRALTRNLIVSSGLSVDYAHARVGLGGVEIEDLRVVDVEAGAREPLLVIDRVEGAWSLWRAALGQAVRVERLRIDGVRVQLDLGGGHDESAAPALVAARPWSAARLAGLLPSWLEVRDLQVERVVVVVDFADGPLARLLLLGFGAHAQLSDDGAELDCGRRALGVLAALRAPAAKARRAPPPERYVWLVTELRAQAALDAHGQLAARLDLETRAHHGWPLAPPRQFLHLLAGARADEADARVLHVEVPELRLYGRVLVVSALAALVPGGDGVSHALVRELHAAFDADELLALARMLGLPWRAGAASLALDAQVVEVLPTVRVLAGGELHARARAASLHAAAVEADGLDAQLRARPTRAGATQLTLSVPVGKLALPGSVVEDGQLELEAEAPALWPPSRWPVGGPTLDFKLRAARATHGGDQLSGVVLAGKAHQHRGVALLGVDGTIERTALRSLPAALDGDRLTLHASGELPLADGGRRLEHVLVSVGAGRLAADGWQLRNAAPLTLTLAAAEAALATPWLASSGEAKIDLGWAPLGLHAVVKKSAHAADLSGDVTLASLAPLATVAGSKVAWDELTLAGHFDSAIGGLGERWREKTSARWHLGTPAWRSPGLDVHARQADVTLRADGDRLRHRVELEATIDDGELVSSPPLVAARRTSAHETVSARVDADLAKLTLLLALRGSGGVAPTTQLDLEANFVPRTRTLVWASRLESSHHGLAPLFLPARLRQRHHLDWDRLRLAGEAKGTLRGLFVENHHGWVPLALPGALDWGAVVGEHHTHLRLGGVAYHDNGDLVASGDGLALDSDGKLADAVLETDVKLSLPSASVERDAWEVSASGFGGSAHVEVDTRARDGRLTLLGHLDELEQSWWPDYDVGRLDVEVRLFSRRLEQITFERVVVANPAGGTRLELGGGVDLEADQDHLAAAAVAPAHHHGAPRRPPPPPSAVVPGRRSLSLSGKLEQRVAELADGEGVVRVPFAVESGDMHAFQVRARVELDDVSVSWPARGLALAHARGRVPIVEDVVVEDGQLRLSDGDVNAYTRLRFLDHHPYLDSDDFLSIKSLRVRGATLGPIAGNLRVDHNLIALDQLEAEAFGGRITLQSRYDAGGDEPTLDVRANVTGVRPGGVDKTSRLDANCALRIRPEEWDIDGRAEIVRISRAHLSSLLDAFDPYRGDVAANRIRGALKLGYPKRVRLRFSHGFAAAAIELGGLAQLVRIDEIRGIPTTPLIEKYVVPLLHWETGDDNDPEVQE